MITSGLNNPESVACDKDGNFFIADRANGAIKKWTASTRAVTVLASGLISPSGVAVAQNGDVYFSQTDAGSGALTRWSAATGAVTDVVTSGFNKPWGVAMHGEDAVVIANLFGKSVSMWKMTTGALKTLFTVTNSFADGAVAVVTDSSGDVYSSFPTANQVWKWSAQSESASVLLDAPLLGNSHARALDMDAKGNLIIGFDVSPSLGHHFHFLSLWQRESLHVASDRPRVLSCRNAP